MQDDNWYLRNRSREAIVDMFRVIRHLQLINGFKTSSILRAMSTVYRDTDGALAAAHLFYVIREIERDERRGL
jgi:hypothetical protein